MRILYVEDNLTNVSLVKRVARNHEVISYIDGEEALKNFKRDNPDLVLMDIQLAGPLNGLQVVEKLRADGHRIPIIAVTAYAMLGDRERCIAAGCDDYVAKPLPIPTLVEMFTKYEKVAQERRQEEATQPAVITLEVEMVPSEAPSASCIESTKDETQQQKTVTNEPTDVTPVEAPSTSAAEGQLDETREQNTILQDTNDMPAAEAVLKQECKDDQQKQKLNKTKEPVDTELDAPTELDIPTEIPEMEKSPQNVGDSVKT